MSKFNPIEIVEAYYTKYTSKKDSPRALLAQKRLEICEACEHNTESAAGKTLNYCAKCGCIIGGKVFSKSMNPCPLQKWAEVDAAFAENQVKTAKKSKNLL